MKYDKKTVFSAYLIVVLNMVIIKTSDSVLELLKGESFLISLLLVPIFLYYNQKEKSNKKNNDK